MLFMLIKDKSARRRPSCRRRAFTNSWRCFAMWYSAFSLRSPSATAFFSSLGSSWLSSCSRVLISSWSFFLSCSVILRGIINREQAAGFWLLASSKPFQPEADRPDQRSPSPHFGLSGSPKIGGLFARKWRAGLLPVQATGDARLSRDPPARSAKSPNPRHDCLSKRVQVNYYHSWSFIVVPALLRCFLMISSDGFHIGDKVVYPNHGVGIIEQISSRTIGASVENFYLLKIKSSSLKVMVPFHNVNSVGLRRVVRNGEIQKILDFLTDGECLNNADWKYRFKENSERMRTGSLLEVASVLKGLLMLNQSKPLSFREKKMLERARYLLVSELAMAKNCEERVIEELLSKALSSKHKLRFPEASEFEA